MDESAISKEAKDFIELEQSKAQMQSAITAITSECWDKCIFSTNSQKLDSTESKCMQNCMNLFVEAGTYISEHLRKNQK
ncbi:hypothetical protein BB561_005741 [Smittium simulii]|uniref:Mitochondrial import inner membrane translocase subunit n=1 Tax=Smittium simulii TaxID=133385 RepID=A0A2T9Y8M0_9FUNG|nr:hypothetical protein BB561_005741 [Smittium simulii]